MQATPPTVLFYAIRRCACDLDIILRLIFYTFLQFELSHFFGHFDNESKWTVGILCRQLLLQFYSYSFISLQMF